MFKLMEFYLQNKCTLAFNNPCNKNKICPKFFSCGVISISWKNSAQSLKREVHWFQVSEFIYCLPCAQNPILGKLLVFASFPCKEQRTLHRTDST